MTRLALGAGLLLPAILTGWLAGNTGEQRVRSGSDRVKTHERVSVWQTREVAIPSRPGPAPVPASSPTGDGDVASAVNQKEESPEASGLVERMRRHLPRVADWQAEQLLRYQKGFKEKLRRQALDVASRIDRSDQGDRAPRFDAVRKLSELRRERDEFFRNVLGRRAFLTWKEFETTGGRDVDEFLRELQERNR